MKLFSKYSNLCEKIYLNVTDGRTDGLTDRQRGGRQTVA